MAFTKSIATALAVTMGALSFAGSVDPVEAAPKKKVVINKYYRGGGGHHYHHGGNVAAGLFGFAAGAVVGSALAAPRYYAPAPVVVAPAPVVVVYEPWTPAWYDYCGGRYRSFNRSTGYYLGYDGGYHFCR